MYHDFRITQEQIAQKAYELWTDRGRLNDQDIQNWYDAECVLEYDAEECRKKESRRSDQELLNSLDQRCLN